jgi:hypothetical protein
LSKLASIASIRQNAPNVAVYSCSRIASSSSTAEFTGVNLADMTACNLQFNPVMLRYILSKTSKAHIARNNEQFANFSLKFRALPTSLGSCDASNRVLWLQEGKAAQSQQVTQLFDFLATLAACGPHGPGPEL